MTTRNMISKANGQSIEFTFPAYAIQVKLDRFRDSRSGGTSAELTAFSTDSDNGRRLLTSGMLDLISARSRAELVKRICELVDVDWNTIVESACLNALNWYRKGEPFIVLEPGDCAHVPFILNPLV